MKKTEWKDPIVEEVRAIREAYAAKFNYDLKLMFEDIRKKEAVSTWPKAKIKPAKPRMKRCLAG